MLAERHQNFAIMRPTPDCPGSDAEIWLEPAGKEDPERVVRSFFNAFGIWRCRRLLWRMLTAPPQDNVSAGNFPPEDHACFIAKIGELVEASYLILLKGEEQEKKYPEKGSVTVTGSGAVSQELLGEIRAFFDAADLASFKATFFNILLAYAGHYCYSPGEPAEVVETLSRLGRLLAGVKEWAGASAAPPGKSPGHAPADPAGVLVRFSEDAAYRNIENTLRSIRFFSLCRQSGMEDGAGIDTLKFYHDITSLAEACDRIRVGADHG